MEYLQNPNFFNEIKLYTFGWSSGIWQHNFFSSFVITDAFQNNRSFVNIYNNLNKIFIDLILCLKDKGVCNSLLVLDTFTEHSCFGVYT